jgi:hypothetical protein
MKHPDINQRCKEERSSELTAISDTNMPGSSSRTAVGCRRARRGGSRIGTTASSGGTHSRGCGHRHGRAGVVDAGSGGGVVGGHSVDVSELVFAVGLDNTNIISTSTINDCCNLVRRNGKRLLTSCTLFVFAKLSTSAFFFSSSAASCSAWRLRSATSFSAAATALSASLCLWSAFTISFAVLCSLLTALSTWCRALSTALEALAVALSACARSLIRWCRFCGARRGSVFSIRW